MLQPLHFPAGIMLGSKKKPYTGKATVTFASGTRCEGVVIENKIITR